MSNSTLSTETEKPPHSLRVLALGDCNTRGIIEPPIGNTIVDKFCQALDRLGYATTKQNLGCGMGSTREGVQQMQRNAHPADVVLINFGLVDTWITSIPQLYVPYYPDNFARKRLRKLLKFIKRRLRSPRLRQYIPVGPVVPIEEYDRHVRTMISLARARVSSATILLWGCPPVQHDPARNVNLERYNQRLELIAAVTSSYFVSSATLVNQLPAEAAYLDAVHLNEAATDAIAIQLVSVYQKQQLAAAG